MRCLARSSEENVCANVVEKPTTVYLAQSTRAMQCVDELRHDVVDDLRQSISEPVKDFQPLASWAPGFGLLKVLP